MKMKGRIGAIGFAVILFVGLILLAMSATCRLCRRGLQHEWGG